MDHADLRNRFTYHPATTTAVGNAHEKVRGLCLTLAFKLDDLLPDGREKSLAMTNLEQVMMWGNAAIARQPAPAPIAGTSDSQSDAE